MKPKDPHDKTGRKCSVCKVEFTRQSLTFSIRKRVGNIIERHLACPVCYNAHYGGGE